MSHLLNKKFLASLTSIILLFVFILPVISLAQDRYGYAPGPYLPGQAPSTGLVPCGNPDQPKCDFSYFIMMINGIINWIISIAVVLFTLSAVYGGYLYLTSGGDSGKTGKARDLLWSTLKGFVIILVAWLIVYTLLTYLVPPGTTENSIFKFLGGR